MDAAGEDRRLLLDGTLIPTWRCAALATEDNDDPLYNAKHRDHGMNLHGITTTAGELVFLGEARPGSTADITAARHDGIMETVTDADVETTADSGYQGAGGTVRTPIKRPAGKGHNGWEKQANTALARLRAPVERAFAELKRWRVLQRIRISPNRITGLAHAIFVIHHEQRSLARA
ncbi:transposase family protein [Streptomyces boninensis]|uniref:transposase family protein n=1 Tax=Streptomyces boninensis TaxID=2039455 RepID=UPI003B218D6C